METAISLLLAILVGIPTILSVLFFLEILCALLFTPAPSVPVGTHRRPRIAVVIPAHNESANVLPTIADVKAQLLSCDRLVVVADNCSDDTETLSKAAGADVIIRNDPTRVGKGFALDWGIRHLRADPPEIVIFVDADCRLTNGVVDQLVAISASANRPVQALYLMTTAGEPSVEDQIAEFTWRIKNWVRPLGLQYLGFPCQLTGTGMAFPWDVIRTANLATGEIVEDLKLGLDLAKMGKPPMFCPSAIVRSQFAMSATGADTQRRRWTQGHVQMIFKTAPHYFCFAIRQGNLGLFAMTLDMVIPPLALLTVLIIGCSAVASVAMFAGFSSLPFTSGVVGVSTVVAGVILAWSKFGRDVMSAHALLALPWLVAKKFWTYRHMLFARKAPLWVRTDRTKSD